MQKVRVGIVGFGFSGATFHAPVISSVDGLELISICTSDSRKVKNKFPHVCTVSNPKELFADPRLDLVVVTAPNKLHFSLVLQALQAGKHVVVEKPFVNTVEEGRQLIAEARDRKLLLSVFHNRRWDNDFLELRRLIEGKQLGEIHYYEANYHRFLPHVQDNWREQQVPGAGILYDLGPHLIDQALLLFGTPDAILADTFAQRANGAVNDYFHIQLHYGKSRIVLQSRMQERGSCLHYQVHGDKASLFLYGTDIQEELLIQGLSPSSEQWKQQKKEPRGTLVQQKEATDQPKSTQVKLAPGSYTSYYEGIYRSIVYDAPLPVTAEQALETIRVIEIVQESSLLGCKIPYRSIKLREME